MKRDFLKDLGLDKETIDKIMDENGKDVEAHNRTKELLTQAQTENEGLKNQITQLNGSIEELKKTAGDNEALQNQINDMQTAHTAEVAALNQKLSDQAYDHAADGFFAGVKFSSVLVEKAVKEDFKSKGYKLDGGKFLGAEGYIDNLKKTDPGVFVEEKDQGDDPEQKPNFPTFTHPMNHQGDKGGQVSNPKQNPLSGLFINRVRGFDNE